MADLTWDYVPSDASPGQSTKPRINRVVFGDGYVQKGADGINVNKRTWNLVYDLLTTAEMETMETALLSVGAGNLLWKPPPANESGDPYVKWDMPEGWARPPIPNSAYWRITFTLEESFG